MATAPGCTSFWWSTPASAGPKQRPNPPSGLKLLRQLGHLPNLEIRRFLSLPRGRFGFSGSTMFFWFHCIPALRCVKLSPLSNTGKLSQFIQSKRDKDKYPVPATYKRDKDKYPVPATYCPRNLNILSPQPAASLSFQFFQRRERRSLLPSGVAKHPL